MSTFKITIGGKKYDVKVNETDLNAAEVSVNGTSYNVEFESDEVVASPRPAQKAASAPRAAAPAAASAPKPAGGGGANSVKSPLPGTITTVNVKAGDSVKRGDVLLVMEAMKMANNISAGKDGVVKAVYVSAGQTVAQDDALVDIE